MTYKPRTKFYYKNYTKLPKAAANDKKNKSQNKSAVQMYCSFYCNKNVNLEDSLQ